VTSSRRGSSGPSTEPTSLRATPALNAIELKVADLVTYCDPPPSFTAAVKGESLVVTLARPAGAVSRCFAPHELALEVALPGRNNVRKVVLAGSDGAEIASATVKSAP